jgi:hyperosmotically inducible protein
MKTLKTLLVTLTVGASLAFAGGAPRDEAALAEQVRHELVLLPWYGVFDMLSFNLDNGKVTLYGAVTRPILRGDAENVVRRIDGVTAVDNKIEVLPLSRFDDQIRLAEYHALYTWPSLSRLSTMALPPVRIIVRNGEVTLEGTVASQADRDALYLRANGIFGVFGVTNNLQVEKRS